MSQTPTSHRTARADASMTLLREVMERPLDPGYEAVARRREAGQDVQTSTLGRRVLVLVLAVALGLGGVWAARELRSPDPGLSARQVLIDQIRERTEAGEALADQNAQLQAEVQQLQDQAFGDAAARTLAEARMLASWAGTIAVTGPGIVIVLEDPPPAPGVDPGTTENRVVDFDLQLITNDLWASGAEAIAINDVRLTAGTAIRTAGQTILVDLESIVSPYTIEVVGDPDGMQTTFAGTQGAAMMQYLASLGISSQMSVDDELHLPAGTAPTLQAAAASEQD